ncbi:hypothetical protein ACQCSU_04515 [Pseudarthrobacter sp. O4]|uniref:sunset domain-containing protein n=1 Tax=Pseudarthrobacter sp. O4 TaxID=3418417 RepID=UPI003CE93195
MDWIIWLIVIVVIVAIVWWLLNRNSRSGTGTSDAGTGANAGAGTAGRPGADASPQAPQGNGTHDGALSGGSAAASAVAAATTGIPTAAGFSNAEPAAPTTAQDSAAARPSAQEPAMETSDGGRGAAGTAPAEWETQWSETPPAEPHAPVHHEPLSGAHAGQGERMTPTGADAAAAENAPVHHPEYTQTHAPTLPGAESAAAEAGLLEEGDTSAPAPSREPQAQAETQQTASSAAASEGFASHSAEPSGHLALDQPYGEGSAAPAADGSGPAGFTVKGNASSMIYHDETSPFFEETRAEVWFLSAAHAEAAGFRPPRRSRQ